MSTVAERIIEVVTHTGMNKSEFARKINVTPAYISKLGKSPDSMPSDRTISDICREFNVNEMWLREGIGEMFQERSRSEELAAFFGDVQADGGFKEAFLTVLARMGPEEWELIERKARELVEEIKKADP